MKKGLLERLAEGPVVIGEGYIFELERRGYIQAGPFVPRVLVDRPSAVSELSHEFLNCGSEVIEALTYYAHREKMRLVGMEDCLEQANRNALRIAKEVAAEGDALVAGNICNSNIWITDNKEREAEVRAMFEEQVGWAKEAEVDFIIGETFDFYGEALLALNVIKEAGLLAVITLAIHENGLTMDGLSPEEACKKLEEAGADVVGLNCARGPKTMLPLLEKITKVVSCPVAALPVPYRTTEKEPCMQSLTENGCRCFPTKLDPFVCNRDEIAEFAQEALRMGVRYIGLCCGAGPHHLRALAVACGKNPPANRNTADMSKHAHFGTDEKVRKDNRDVLRKAMGIKDDSDHV
ncbi:Homocysteine S-methyltransferase family protein [Balamuthia mandrillaris]